MRGKSKDTMSTLILSSPERFQASHRRSYTLTEKLNVLEAISNNEDNNVSSVARQHDVSRTLVYKWQDQKDSLLLANEQRTNPRRVSGGGRPSTIPNDVKEHLLLALRKMKINWNKYIKY